MTSLPNPSRKGPRDSLAPGSGQIAHIVPIYDHIHLYIYIYLYKYKHRKLLGKQCAIVCTAYTS